MLVRKRIGVPYLLAMLILYSALTVPLWISRGDHSLWIPAILTATVLLSVLVPISLIGGREEMRDGTDFVLSAPAHIVTILAYLIAPALYR
jgi:hypothetical protein